MSPPPTCRSRSQNLWRIYKGTTFTRPTSCVICPEPLSVTVKSVHVNSDALPWYYTRLQGARHQLISNQEWPSQNEVICHSCFIDECPGVVTQESPKAVTDRQQHCHRCSKFAPCHSPKVDRRQAQWMPRRLQSPLRKKVTRGNSKNGTPCVNQCQDLVLSAARKCDSD